MQLSRTNLERIKWCLFIGVPIWFGYGFARDPANLEWVKRVFPTKAADPQGDHGRLLPTLEDEYRRVTLERAIDAALEDIQRRKAAQGDKQR